MVSIFESVRTFRANLPQERSSSFPPISGKSARIIMCTADVSEDAMAQPTQYAVLTEDGRFADTGDGVAIADSKEEAQELKEWIAIEFMGFDDASQFSVVELKVTPLE